MRRVSWTIGALLAVLWMPPLQAQVPTGTIRGRVTDAGTQQPLAGATVTFGGRGVLTLADGRYEIAGARVSSDTLRARMLGYGPAARSVTVAAGEVVVVDFGLEAQAVGLAAVVVTGYGEQRAGDITGAVSTVSSEEFNTGRIISPALLIQNKVAGVQVVDNNEPGGGLSIRIRGTTSINASSEPLYVVDGVPLGTGAGGGLSSGRDPLNFINPNEIENITVLRDASASAIYGTNASSGVVIITTRAGLGREGTQFEYSGSFSGSSVDQLPNMMSAAEFTNAVETYAPSRVDSLLGQNTNWLNGITQSAFGQEHNLSVAGAGSDMDYRLSVGYLNQEGIVKASTVERVTLGLTYNQQLFNDRLSVRTALRGSRADDHFTPGDVLGNAAAMAPTQPVEDRTSATGYWDWNTTNASPSNPMASLALASDIGTTWRGLASIRTTWRAPVVDGLSANLNLSYDNSQGDRRTFFPSKLAAQVRQGQGSFYRWDGSQGIGLLEAFLGYTPQRTLGPGTVDLVAGYSYKSSRSENAWYTGTGLNSDLLGTDGFPDAKNVSNTMYNVDYKLISVYGRASYNIRDKYLASVTYRTDGSSRFGSDNQWGNFPSVALAWRLSEESFLQSWDFLSDLKLRVSWARTGNQEFGDYLAFSTYTYSDALTRAQFGTEFVTTIRPSAVDPTIRWETTDAYDVGLDYGISGQRFSGAIDFYRRNTDDLIFGVPVAAGTNVGNYVTTNIGSMRNTGFEFNLNARVLEGQGRGFAWTASFNAAYNKNKLLSIDPLKAVPFVETGYISGGTGNAVQVMMPGSPVNSFWVYQHRRDANGRPVYGDGPDPGTDTTNFDLYVDQPTVLDTIVCRGPNPAAAGCVGDYRPDGQINNFDRRPFHDPLPKWILGFSSYFTYRGFDGSFTLRAHLGNWTYNNVASGLGAYQNLTGSGMPANLHRSVLETGFVKPQYQSDYYVEDASFLRMDNITIGYSFAYRGQPFRVYATMQNAFTITGYSGVDPTAGVNGLDSNIYPRSRTITGGLNVRF